MTWHNNNRDAAVKILIITFLSAIFLVLVYNVLSTGGTGIISRIYYGHGFDLNNFVMSILVVSVKLLWLIFVVSLIVGLVVLARKNFIGVRKVNQDLVVTGGNGYACPHCNIKLTTDFKFCPKCKASLKDICLKCGKELQVGWKCCPLCGTEKRVR